MTSPGRTTRGTGILWLFIAMTVQLLIQSCAQRKASVKETLTAEEVIENYIKAKGGREKMRQVKSYSMKMSDQEKGMYIESHKVFPDKLHDIFKFPNGSNTTILNGNEAVLILPDTTLQITDPIALRNMMEDATIFSELYAEELGHNYQYKGYEVVDGVKLHQVQVTLQDNSQRAQYYDEATWLLRKVTYHDGSESLLGNYKAVDGIKIPHTFTVVNTELFIQYTITHFQFNQEIDEKLFEIQK